ncbi:hypothetical protein HKX48_005601 [Thoreauomyces humboldtii]|nr:hypothetical protein HKX48_005601 [Thoreauomyces humboldtii]
MPRAQTAPSSSKLKFKKSRRSGGASENDSVSSRRKRKAEAVAAEYIDSLPRPPAPSQFAPLDDYEPPPSTAHKPDPLFQSLWDDLGEDADSSQDFWSAQWASTREPNREQTNEDRSYDEWADEIRRGMAKKLNGDRDAERRRAEKRKRDKSRQAKIHLETVTANERTLRRDADLSRARQAYRAAWSTIRSTVVPSTLTLADLPWPGLPGEATSRAAISAFLFEGCSFEDAQRKKMVKDALLLWHPDKFKRNEGLFKEDARDKVSETVNVIVGALNELYSEL